MTKLFVTVRFVPTTTARSSSHADMTDAFTRELRATLGAMPYTPLQPHIQNTKSRHSCAIPTKEQKSSSNSLKSN